MNGHVQSAVLRGYGPSPVGGRAETQILLLKLSSWLKISGQLHILRSWSWLLSHWAIKGFRVEAPCVPMQTSLCISTCLFLLFTFINISARISKKWELPFGNRPQIPSSSHKSTIIPEYHHPIIQSGFSFKCSVFYPQLVFIEMQDHHHGNQ